MNLQLNENFSGQQLSRQWSPLISQQLRLRHLRRIIAYNIASEHEGEFYYTLHQTSMCAPFYTSEKISNPNPRWIEGELAAFPNSSIKACVVRIWQTNEEMDKIVVTWGINFSGLVYLGSKLTEVQPSSFKENTVILHMYGGFFTSAGVIRRDLQNFVPFIDHLNLVSTEDNTKVYRTVSSKVSTCHVKKSYNLERLRRLQSCQVNLKNRNIELENIKCKINFINGVDKDGSTASSSTPAATSESGIRYAPQLLTMNSLNKMLHEKPTKMQQLEILRLSKEIEAAKFKIKALLHVKDKKLVYVRQLKEKYSKICDKNDEKEFMLMERYRQLSKDIDKMREGKREQIHHREILLDYNTQLHLRQKQLLSQLLELYPIENIADDKYDINSVYLPSSELLNDCSQNDGAVALGFVAHVVVMCSIFLQVPLRYPIIHMGSRSMIIDHISQSIGENKQQYPLYLRGKDKYNFNLAVCLLNKNIAQLRWICGLHTQNLKATLPNLLTFLLQDSRSQRERSKLASNESQAASLRNESTQAECRASDTLDGTQKNSSAYSSSSSISFDCFGSLQNISDPILNSLRHECQSEKTFAPRFRPSERPARVFKVVEQESSLSQVLAIPEAFLNQQISPNSFKSYMTQCKRLGDPDGLHKDSLSKEKNEVKVIESNRILSCDIMDGEITGAKNNAYLIEQGADLTDPSVCQQLKVDSINSQSVPLASKTPDLSPESKRLSRSLEFFVKERVEKRDKVTASDSALNGSMVFNDDIERNQNEDEDFRVRKWLDDEKITGGDEQLKHEEKSLKNNEQDSNNDEKNNYPLTQRTDALMNTTSFHMLKPK